LPGEGWLESTIMWWKTIWASPMASVWQDADLGGLHRLAVLRDAQHRGELPVTGLAAIQSLEDHYGLNPKARRVLQWEVARAEVVDHPTRTSRRSLRAIDPN
jgi:hypothetical protein